MATSAGRDVAGAHRVGRDFMTPYGRSQVLALAPTAAAVSFILFDIPMLVVSPRNRPGDLIPFILVPIVAAVGAGIIGMPILWLSLRVGWRRFWQISAAGLLGGVLAGHLFVMGTDSERVSSNVLHAIWNLRGFGVLGASVAAVHWIWLIGRASHRVATSIAVLLVAEAMLLLDIYPRLSR